VTGREPRRRFRVSTRLAVVAALVAALGLGALASRAEDDSSGSEANELSKDAKFVLDGGLNYLADDHQQGADGSLKVSGTRGGVILATTSLAGLAWLAAGSTPTRGPYRTNIVRALEFVVNQRDRTSQKARDNPNYTFFAGITGENTEGRMHAHGFATLFLAEALGMLGKRNEKLAVDVRSTLEGAVKLSIASQTKNRGGWGYAFAGETSFLLDSDEASTTITQVQALRAARNAGLSVSPRCIDRAVKYVKTCITEKGDCIYSLTMQDGRRTSFELTAAAVSTLNAAGTYRSDKLDAALGYLRRELGKKAAANKKPTEACEQYYFYGNLYAAQAMFQAGGADWKTWWKGAQEDLVSKAKRHGDQQYYWDDEPRPFGKTYSTASACLILALPMRYLPIFER
jgi:hypothetical protein